MDISCLIMRIGFECLSMPVIIVYNVFFFTVSLYQVNCKYQIFHGLWWPYMYTVGEFSSLCSFDFSKICFHFFELVDFIIYLFNTLLLTFMIIKWLIESTAISIFLYSWCYINDQNHSAFTCYLSVSNSANNLWLCHFFTTILFLFLFLGKESGS